jgi:hypothetical protein
MLRLDGSGNFNETNDGAPYERYNQPGVITPADTASNGYARARALVAEMNNQAANNPMNANPAGTSNPPKGYSYALNGVYFHRVHTYVYESVKNDNNNIYTTYPFDTYGVNKATEVNMFMMGNYTNGACCDVGGVACTLGYNPNNPSSYWVKVFNSHEFYRWRQENNGNTIPINGNPYTIPQNSMPFTANTLGHEMGHVLGLWHTFERANNCSDASVANRGDGWNNLMDYSGGIALTPCQLGVVDYNLYNPGTPANSFRNYLSNSACGEVPPRAFFVMYACLNPGNVYMDSRGTFMADRMTVRVYAHDPSAANGRGALLATTASNVSRGGRWNLARIHSFSAGQQYYVELTASRASGQTHTRGQVIQVVGPLEGACGSMPAPGTE